MDGTMLSANTQIQLLPKNYEANASQMVKEKLAVFVTKPTRLVETISCVRDITGFSIAEIKQNILQARPVFHGVVFRNDHEDMAAVLLRFLDEIPKSGADVAISEHEPEEEVSALVASREISPETLRNVLESYRSGFQRLKEYDDMRSDGE